EPLGKLDLELCGLMLCRCDSGKDVTRQQAHSEPVRIVKNDRVVDGQVKRRGGRYGRSQRALTLRGLHPADFLTAAGLCRPRENFSASSRTREARRPWLAVDLGSAPANYGWRWAAPIRAAAGERGSGFMGEIRRWL
ncbi:MAG TPA: hypothetical protein VMV92_10090, partial [Streptosporangiaceae bacterium]|nr:hypothetical protein [Streptosporangiaceae bacterium]